MEHRAIVLVKDATWIRSAFNREINQEGGQGMSKARSGTADEAAGSLRYYQLTPAEIETVNEVRLSPAARWPHELEFIEPP